MISEHILYMTFLNEPELIFFCKQLNGFTYYYQMQILFTTIVCFTYLSKIAMYH